MSSCVSQFVISQFKLEMNRNAILLEQLEIPNNHVTTIKPC